MRSLGHFIIFGAVFAAASSALAAPPQIAELSSTAVPQSGRLRILGSGFGMPPGLSPDARVEIGGVAVATARWTDTGISAYVTDKVPLGETTVRVITSEGASAALPLTIEPLPPPDGDIAWKFQVDGISIERRVGVGPDGTVIASDRLGYVYALGEDGLLRWIHDAPRRAGYEYGVGDEGPVAVGADGTSYVSIDMLGPDLHLHALNPDGSVKWMLNKPLANTASGPAIGPDGDVYWATTTPGGLQRISPSGEIVWTNAGAPAVTGAYYERSYELAFGPSAADGPVDRVYFALTTGDLYQDKITAPYFYGFDLDGQQLFANKVGSLSGSFQPRGQVSVGPDGTVYLASWNLPEAWGLHAYTPSGEKKWSYLAEYGNIMSAADFDPAGNIYVMHDGSYLTSLDASGSLRWETTMEMGSDLGPAVSPDGRMILIDGGDIAPDGRLSAFDPETGALLWLIDFPVETGTFQTPSARARFTDDGARAYVSTHFGGQPKDEEYGYLYALDVGDEPDPDTGGETGGDTTDGGTTGDGTTGDGTGTATTSAESGDEGASSGPTEGSGGESSGSSSGGEDDGSSAGDSGGAQDGSGTEGCGCSETGGQSSAAALALAVAAFVRRRRR